MTQQLERRYIKIDEIRINEDSRTVCGYAVKFDSLSQDLGFYETIKSGAITEETIKQSDIYAKFNHRDDAILARSRYGEGTLRLELREDGLYYEFEAPHTVWGDELLEHIRNGNLYGSSFAFLCEQDKWSQRDGQYYRDVLKIKYLGDVSPVFEPAYLDTYVDKRGMEQIKKHSQNTMENEKTLEEQIAELQEELKSLREQMQPEKEDEMDEETPANNEEEKPVDEDPAEEKQCEEDDPAKEQRNKNINTIKMEQRFNLLKELKNAYETGTTLKLNEVRAYTVTDEGDDVVKTDIFDIWGPLTANTVLADAGVKFITGIKDNVKIPLMSVVSCAFKGETATADNGSGTFTNKTLSPKRITAKYPISLELLAQDSIGVENHIREEIIKAVGLKLEEVLLGDGAGSDDIPAGLFHGKVVKTISTFEDVANLEAEVEGANVNGECKYIMNPKAKAKLRTTIKGTNGTGNIFENGEVDGTPALITTNVADSKMIYGDFSNVVCAAWDNVQLDVVRDVASLENGQVTIVVNAFVDGGLIRENALACGTTNMG